MYRYSQYGMIEREADRKYISPNLDSPDYQELQAWLAEGNEVLPFEPAKLTKQQLIDAVAMRRWHAESGGINFYGTPISTDREAQSMINGAYTSMKNGLIVDTPWKSATGTFTLIGIDVLEPIARAVAEHVRACFAAERVHCEAIALLNTQEELDNYVLNVGWPDQSPPAHHEDPLPPAP